MRDIISRSEKKRRFKQVEAAAMELSQLSNKDLENFPGDESIKKEVVACRGLKGGAKKRQIKYLAKVIRQHSLDEVYEYLTNVKGSALQGKKLFHEAERLRDTLINDALNSYQNAQQEQVEWEPDWASDTLQSVMSFFPDLNENDIRKTVYQYVRSRNRQHYRELFRILKAAIEAEERKKKFV